MSAESLDFVPSTQRERTDYFYLRNVVQGALANEWVKTHSDDDEMKWFTLYHAAFKQIFPSPAVDPVLEAETAKFVAFLKQASPEDASLKLAELQARLDKMVASVS
jgi:hypothetical protein